MIEMLQTAMQSSGKLAYLFS